MASPFKLHLNVRAIPDLQCEHYKESKSASGRRVYPYLHSQEQPRNEQKRSGTLFVHPLPKLPDRPRTAPNTSFRDVRIRCHEHLDLPSSSHHTTLPELTSEHRTCQQHGHRSSTNPNKEGRRRHVSGRAMEENCPVTPVSTWCQHSTLPSIYKEGHRSAKPLSACHPPNHPSEIRDYCFHWTRCTPKTDVFEKTKHSRSPCRLIISPTLRCVSFALSDDDPQ